MSITTLPRRALTAWREHRQQARAWTSGADLLAGSYTAELPVVELPPWHNVPPRTSAPACAAGRARCRECRLGGDCRTDEPQERPAYAAGKELPRNGRHTDEHIVAAWLADAWGGLAQLPIGVRRRIGHIAGTIRVPAALPIGRLA